MTTRRTTGRDRAATGIYPSGNGFRAVVSRGQDKPQLRRFFPAGTSVATMQAWRKDVQAKSRLKRKQRASAGTFEGDARKYLRLVAGLPTFKDRAREIELWIAIFQTRQRDEIAAGEIRGQRDTWAREPRSATDKRPVAAATINKRLRALSNLYTVLDGPRADNPVRDVPELREPTARDRSLPFDRIEAILAQLPDQGRPTGKGKGTRPTDSQSKARLRVMAYTGWPSGVLAKITPDDLDLDAGLARLPERSKGAGADAVVVPLLPAAVDALKEMARLKCWGPFSRSALRKTFKRAAKKAGHETFRIYDLRHSFATRVARASRDERAVQHLLQHRSLSTTRKYTIGSVPERALTAIAALQDQIGEEKKGRGPERA